MKAKFFLWLAVVLSSGLMGCAMHRGFRGTTSNLEGNGTQTVAADFLKMSLKNSGTTSAGGNYIILSLPAQNCELAIFYPKLQPWPQELLRAELNTNRIHVWQIKQGQQSSNYVAIKIRLSPKQMGVWFIRGNHFKRARIKSGPEGNIPDEAERLYGQIEMLRNGGEFQINADLSGDDGTKLTGIFDSYSQLWKPLAFPAALMFGPEGPSWERRSKPLPSVPRTNDLTKP